MRRKNSVKIDWLLFVDSLRDENALLYIVEAVIKSFCNKKMGKNFGFVDLKRGKYSIAMQAAVGNIMGTIGPALQKLKVRVDEKMLVRLLYDYLSALLEAFNRRNIRSFYIVQIGGMYALEVFQDWITETWNDIDEYVRSVTQQITKSDKRLIRKVSKKKVGKSVVGKLFFRNLFSKSNVPGLYELKI